MKWIARVILGVVCCFASESLAEEARPAVLPESHTAPALYLPPDLKALWEKAGGSVEDLKTELNPFYLSGDFDGDGRRDYVLWARREAWTGFVVVFANGKQTRLEQDERLRFPGTTDYWYVHARHLPVNPSPAEDEAKPVPKLKGDALLFIKSEASSSLVYWNGKRFVSYWQAD
ncbi:hypothetical protein ATI61_106379 [Archangium gephyra]|uniref:VCBS repeat-containing protein n=1 Tax=Archangium gephyra TaxID=48 RepID=A0AAC8Q1B0_9BACT|nr:hypothetical protein [Archangium gephyra]AKI99000.1 Hypothetical protein AA314_00627 [Archangium gephyra]REG30909.1 hypothetical protein ATI61_106379 [Archangium gephyra]